MCHGTRAWVSLHHCAALRVRNNEHLFLRRGSDCRHKVRKPLSHAQQINDTHREHSWLPSHSTSTHRRIRILDMSIHSTVLSSTAGIVASPTIGTRNMKMFLNGETVSSMVVSGAPMYHCMSLRVTFLMVFSEYVHTCVWF